MEITAKTSAEEGKQKPQISLLSSGLSSRVPDQRGCSRSFSWLQQLWSKRLVYTALDFLVAPYISRDSRELGIGIVPYCPLGRGFFAGKAVVEALPPNSFLASHPRLSGENFDKNKILYTRVANLAAKHGCTPAQLALAWVLHQGDDVVPIPGTTKIKNLDDNIGSLKLKLTEADMKEISDAVPVDEVAGPRSYQSMYSRSWTFANTPPKDGKIST